MIAYCVVGTVVITRDKEMDKAVVLHLQSSQSNDGVTKIDICNTVQSLYWEMEKMAQESITGRDKVWTKY